MGGRAKAAAVLMNEMENADYSKDRINAADKFLVHTAPVEGAAIELNISAGDSFKDIFTSQMASVVAKQRKEIEAGITIVDAQSIAINFDKRATDG